MRLPDGFPGSVPYPSCLDCDALRELSHESSTTAIRLHPDKGQHLMVLQDVVPWHARGRYLAQRPAFLLDPDWHTGAYYVQDASSMLLLPALEATGIRPEDAPCVLDLCGAPGGKSTLAAEWLAGQGALVANEVIRARSTTLASNLTKAGYSNTIVTQMDPKVIGAMGNQFDIIIVDAPCSGEGLWRKTPESINEWSVEHVHYCAKRQQRILDDVLPALKPGGYLIYATCTYNELENISQVDRLLEEYDLECLPIRLDKRTAHQMATVTGKNSMGLQAIAGQARGEGQFIALLRKQPATTSASRATAHTKTLTQKEKALAQPFVARDLLDLPAVITKAGVLFLLPASVVPLYQQLSKKGRVVRAGLLAGKITDRLFVPSHELAQSLGLKPEVPRITVGQEEALNFLRRQHQTFEGPKGWTILSYNNNALGWAKNLGKRINNYLPKNLVLNR